MKEHAEAVVVEPPHSEPAALHPLHAQVQPFGGTVAGTRVVVGEDLGAPRLQGATERADLLDVVVSAALDRLVDEGGGLVPLVGEIDVPNRFLGQPCAQHLVSGVANAKAQQHPPTPSVVEAFGAGEQQLADPIQRVALAPPVLQGLLLDSTSDLVETAVADADDVNGSATRVAWAKCGVSPAR
jgi:hypothetical protein